VLLTAIASLNSGVRKSTPPIDPTAVRSSNSLAAIDANGRPTATPDRSGAETVTKADLIGPQAKAIEGRNVVLQGHFGRTVGVDGRASPVVFYAITADGTTQVDVRSNATSLAAALGQCYRVFGIAHAVQLPQANPTSLLYWKAYVVAYTWELCSAPTTPKPTSVPPTYAQ
jgi:hypothetical protein